MSNKEILPLLIRAIHLDLEQRLLTFVTDDQSLIRLTYSPAGLEYELTSTSLASTKDVEEVQAERREPQPLLTLSGRLLSQPRSGRPDSKGKATAWAHFLTRDEGDPGGHRY